MCYNYWCNFIYCIWQCCPAIVKLKNVAWAEWIQVLTNEIGLLYRSIAYIVFCFKCASVRLIYMLEYRKTYLFQYKSTGILLFYINLFDSFKWTKGLFLFYLVHKITGSRNTVRIIYLYAKKSNSSFMWSTFNVSTTKLY